VTKNESFLQLLILPIVCFDLRIVRNNNTKSNSRKQEYDYENNGNS
jgi:hypothetical protein